jgi:hypothetical protein
MSAATEIATLPRRGMAFPGLASLVTLARRRFQLTVRTPRELVVPLVTPILFALVIAPALKTRCTRVPGTSPSWRSGRSGCSSRSTRWSPG